MDLRIVIIRLKISGADPEGVQWGCSNPAPHPFWQELFHFHGEFGENLEIPQVFA